MWKVVAALKLTYGKEVGWPPVVKYALIKKIRYFANLRITSAALAAVSCRKL